MIHQHELKAEDVRAYTIRTLKTRFEIEAHGYCCTTNMIYDVLMKASAECSSLEATCADLEQVADSNTLLGEWGFVLSIPHAQAEIELYRLLAPPPPAVLDRLPVHPHLTS